MLLWAGFGLDGAVINNLERRWWGSKLSHAASTVRTLPFHAGVGTEITIDGNTHTFDRLMQLLVVNGSQYIDMLQLNPQAQMNDGKFEAIMFPGRHGFQLLADAVHFRRHEGRTLPPGVKKVSGEVFHLQVETSRKLAYHLDAERRGDYVYYGV